MEKPSWSVVATVDEPAPLVLAFVHHHLAIGAREVFVFLDGPNPEAEDHLKGLPGCHLTVCTETWWRAQGKKQRPKLHPARQMWNANLAYRTTRADWLLHCDCDEFLRDDDGLTQDLARRAEGRVWLRLTMAERAALAPESDPAASIFEGVFRHHIERYDRDGPGIYGPLMPYLRHGLTGHKAGKPIVRTGLPVEIGIHYPKDHQPHLIAPSVKLLHFDGLTPLHFLLKVLRRAKEPVTGAPPRHNIARLAQMAALSEVVATPEEARDFANLLRVLTPEQITGLRKLKLLDERPFRPLGPNPLADRLTVAAMDAELRQRYAGFIAEHGVGF